MNETYRRFALYPNGFCKTDSDTATVVFTRTDGIEVVVENAIYDTAGPVGANPGVIAVETSDERGIVHVPFVAFWTVK